MKTLCDESALDVFLTGHAGHAEEFAATCAGYDTALALGGDGTVHEVVNGLMQLERDKRPRLGVIPLGSGNDYARTLCMPFGVDAAVKALKDAMVVNADVGRCNNRYFAETLSFGLDAGIALDTQKRRMRSGTAGLRLYAMSSANQLLRHKDTYHFFACIDGREQIEGDMLLFAVQNGRTYGSGFAICPNARIDDGRLDICIAHAPINTAKAAFLFLRAKNGKHIGYKEIEFVSAAHLSISFDRRPPVQIDGEELIADSCEVDIVPQAIGVYTLAQAGQLTS